MRIVVKTHGIVRFTSIPTWLAERPLARSPGKNPCIYNGSSCAVVVLGRFTAKKYASHELYNLLLFTWLVRLNGLAKFRFRDCTSKEFQKQSNFTTLWEAKKLWETNTRPPEGCKISCLILSHEHGYEPIRARLRSNLLYNKRYYWH